MKPKTKLIVSTESELNSNTKNTLLNLLVIGTVVCDLLSLCHLIPTHSQHIHRPYLLSMVPFKVFKN